jgi:hypothetical protein
MTLTSNGTQLKSLSLLAAGVLPVRLDSPAPGLTRRELEVLRRPDSRARIGRGPNVRIWELGTKRGPETGPCPDEVILAMELGWAAAMRS